MHKIKTYVFAAHAQSASRKSSQLPSARGISVVFPIIAPSVSVTSSFILPSSGSTQRATWSLCDLPGSRVPLPD